MVEGKALTALAEVAMLREGDLTKATELVDAALEALPEEGRFGALEVRGRIAWWTGDFEAQERLVAEELEIAHRLERKDLEAHALEQLAGVHRHLGRLDEAEQTLRRGLELAEESGSIVARAQALHSLGALRLERRETGIGKEQLEEAKSLFAEVGDAWMLGRTFNSLAWAAELEGGPRNGTLTALEDFVNAHEGMRLATVAAFFGFGVVWHQDAPWAEAVARLLEPWDRNPLLERLEANRVGQIASRHIQGIKASRAFEEQQEWARGQAERLRELDERLRAQTARLREQRELLVRILNSRAIGVAELLSRVRRGSKPAISREEIRRVLAATDGDA